MRSNQQKDAASAVAYLVSFLQSNQFWQVAYRALHTVDTLDDNQNLSEIVEGYTLLYLRPYHIQVTDLHTSIMATNAKNTYRSHEVGIYSFYFSFAADVP